MISKSLISFDAHSQTGGTEEVRYVGEELLAVSDPLQVTSTVLFRLPFRLRVGARTAFEVGGITPARILVTNNIDMADPKVQEEIKSRPPFAHPDMASNVYITLKPMKLSEEDKVEIRQGLEEADISKAVMKLHSLFVHPEDPLKPLNLLIAHYRVLFGKETAWSRVRRVLRRDASGGHTYKLHIFTRQNDAMDFNQIQGALSNAIPRSSNAFEVGGSLTDMPADTVNKLKELVKRGAPYTFYSMAFQAEDYVRQTDYLNALLYSVIALENAHSEMIEHISETKVESSKGRKWAQELLRRAGISSMIRLTPYLFMDPDKRPSNDIISSVLRAIEIRNELVHAKRDKDRNSKIDNHRSDDLLPLVNATIGYINAIAQQLPD